MSEREHSDEERNCRGCSEVIHGLRCNCGGPAMGTGHSPDCEWVLGLDDLAEEHASGVL
jgi:hypothetical protein